MSTLYSIEPSAAGLSVTVGGLTAVLSPKQATECFHLVAAPTGQTAGTFITGHAHTEAVTRLHVAHQPDGSVLIQVHLLDEIGTASAHITVRAGDPVTDLAAVLAAAREPARAFAAQEMTR
jgi:hypothetical protein